MMKKARVAFAQVSFVVMILSVRSFAPPEVRVEARPVALRVPVAPSVEVRNNPLRSMYVIKSGEMVRLNEAELHRYLTSVSTENHDWVTRYRVIYGEGTDANLTKDAKINERLLELRKYELELRRALDEKMTPEERLRKLDELMQKREATLNELLEKLKGDKEKKVEHEVLGVDKDFWTVRSAVTPDVAAYLARPTTGTGGGTSGPGGHDGPGRPGQVSTADPYVDTVKSIFTKIRAQFETMLGRRTAGERLGSKEFLDALESRFLSMEAAQRRGAMVLLNELKTMTEVRTSSETKAPLEAILLAMMELGASPSARREVYQMRDGREEMQTLGKLVVFRNRLTEELLTLPEFKELLTDPSLKTAQQKLEYLKKNHKEKYDELMKRIENRFGEFVSLGAEGVRKLFESSTRKEKLFKEFAHGKEGEMPKELEPHKRAGSENLAALCGGGCFPWLASTGVCKLVK